MTDPAALRQSYAKGRLDETEVADTWLGQLQGWFAEAVADPAIVEANAVQLATADATGRPDVRTVLAKAIDERGVVFYTNHDSAKGRDLATNPRAALVFAWLAQERQVRLAGAVEQVTRAETDAYFATRPRESQLGAWASPQSQVVTSRAALEAAEADAARRFADAPVPAPPHWGGFLLVPDSVEFWQGRRGRLHDRVRYRRAGDEWAVERLAP
ncbi:Pyridoxamine 5'-phosphate oxidase [Jatrophihabitans endophyticus]|uniref:Pyridoxine/pyridoxamine 5'-phosphate oxidase n=1 Tax=Jatrophihabitans endophyticus TaxID=1206085 RepID=A0A1M5RKF9_9ACTN|nr:pyridoxamine 5'-phosphate oxidase [Jatrophihabitans endophyticus]SHH26323.1 Pyridoxamine 5'-phosphate oxidase [Jatrophihabitans endophyticus]